LGSVVFAESVTCPSRKGRGQCPSAVRRARVSRRPAGLARKDIAASASEVGSRCGAVAVVGTYLLPPLSSGGASLARHGSVSTSEPSICTSSPRQSRRRRGWCGTGRRCRRSCHSPSINGRISAKIRPCCRGRTATSSRWGSGGVFRTEYQAYDLYH